jgi:eukaryotic-like serine/threonine-protein kinase
MDDSKKNEGRTPQNENNFPTVSLPDFSVVIGNQIGPYKLLSIIGEGGFGIVYLAEQKTPIKRQVALKIIKPGMDSKQVIARFEAESQALALLDHPNIAYVLGAGATESGRPYFAMEYIKGIPITEYCDREKLSIEDRLKLFIQVCNAVQYAHQKGIIHRDIKPSNIVVSVQDNKAIPKIIDFGVAKAIAMPLTEKTLFTQQGQLIGTPEYMSPEQADMKERDIDTRTDIYSLGIVLYELLAGTLPFEPQTLREGGYAEIQRIIREQEPPRPSTKLSSLGEDASRIAQSRQTQLSTLVKSLHTELEWIPLMAMRKDRDQRYKTASDLAEDIQNYLDGNPLNAGPESKYYMAKKFIKRKRALVTTIAIVLTILIVGIVVSTIFAIGQARANNQAIQALYSSRVSLAAAECEKYNIKEARDLLRLCPKYLREWEWYYLWHISDCAKKTLHGHEDKVLCVAFSHDGKLLASGGSDNKIKVWDVASGHEIVSLINQDQVCSVTFNKDGTQIASGSGNGQIKLWALNKDKELATLKGHKDPVSFLRFCQDGKFLISGSENSTVKVWDLDNKQEISESEKQKISGQLIDVSKDEKKIVSLYSDPNIVISVWDAESGKLLNEIARKDYFGPVDEGPPSAVHFSPDGKQLLICSASRSVLILNSETLKREHKIIYAHRFGIDAVAFSPDGSLMVSGDWRGELKVWDTSTEMVKRIYLGHNEHITSVAFSPDGSLIASASWDKTIRLWDINQGGAERMPGGGTACLSFNHDGTRLVCGGYGETLKIWSTNDWKVIKELHGLITGTITSVLYSPHSNQFFSASRDGSLRVWSEFDENPKLILTEEKKPIHSIACNADGSHIVSGHDDGAIKVWDVTKENPFIMQLNGHSGPVHSLSYSPDGGRIVSGSDDKTIKIWNLNTGKTLKTIVCDVGVRSVVFSPDGKDIASGFYDGTIKLWDSQTLKQKSIFQGHRRAVTNIVFSKNGKRIYSSSRDWTVKVWDVTTKSQLITLLPSYGGPISSLDISKDNKTLAATCDYAGTLVVWESSDPEEIMDVESTSK